MSTVRVLDPQCVAKALNPERVAVGSAFSVKFANCPEGVTCLRNLLHMFCTDIVFSRNDAKHDKMQVYLEELARNGQVPTEEVTIIIDTCYSSTRPDLVFQGLKAHVFTALTSLRML